MKVPSLNDAAGILKGLGGAEAAAGRIENIKKGFKNVVRLYGAKGAVQAATNFQQAYSNLRARSTNALNALQTSSQGLSLTNLDTSNIPSLIDTAANGLQTAAEKQQTAKINDQIDARRNYILARMRAPGRAGTTYAGGS